MAEPRNITILLLALILIDFCAAQTRNDSIRLMEDVLRGYNRKHRPVLNYFQPVQVNATFDVISLQDFDEVNGVISVVLIMYLTWFDEIIVWDPASYGGIESQLYDIEDIWYPLLVTGSSSENFKDLAEDWMTLRIHSSGLALFIPGLLIKSTCGVDVTFYPLDVQNCRLVFSTWADSSKEVLLTASGSRLQSQSSHAEHGEWKIVGVSFYRYLEPYNFLYLDLKLERKPLFALVNTVLPVVLMSALNVLVFVLPADSGERVSFTITVLLAIAVFLTLIADNLPKTSEPISVLAYFLMTNLLISCLICITTILNLRTFYNSDDRQVPVWQQRMARIVGCSRIAVRDKDSRYIDRMTGNNSSDRCTDIEDTKDLNSEVINHLVAWKDVAKATDKILLIVFCLVSLVNTILFLVIITCRLDILTSAK